MGEQAQPVLQWQGKFLRVLKSGHWEYADRIGTTGAVAIVALTPEQELILTEQYRLPVNSRVIELPAGLAGDTPSTHKEVLAEAAKRELFEETGFVAGEMTELASGPPSAGLASEIVTFFRATALRWQGPGGGEGNEQIQVHRVPIKTVEAWLKERTEAGLLVDPKVYAGLYFIAARQTGYPAGSLDPDS